MKQRKLIFNFFAKKKKKKLTDSRKRAKILDDNRKSHHLIETQGPLDTDSLPGKAVLEALLRRVSGNT